MVVRFAIFFALLLSLTSVGMAQQREVPGFVQARWGITDC
jgi:hypothetical protein